MNLAEQIYQVAASTQTTGIQRFDPDPGASQAIEQAQKLRTLLLKLRFTKNLRYTLSADGEVQGGTPMATQLYDTIREGCFAPLDMWHDGLFDPRLELFWTGLKGHPVLSLMFSEIPDVYNRMASSPRPSRNPMIVDGLNDFLRQLEPRMASQRFKTRVSKHQTLYTQRVARIKKQLELLVQHYPGSTWISLSLWLGIPSPLSHTHREKCMALCCERVKNAISTCLPGKDPVVLLRPVLQRDGWVRVDVALASPHVYFVERARLAGQIIDECVRGYQLGAWGLVQLEPRQEVDTGRVYTPGLGHWEATRRLALYFGGADMALAHCKLKDAELFTLDVPLLSSWQLGTVGPDMAAWPFPRNAQFNPRPR